MWMKKNKDLISIFDGNDDLDYYYYYNVSPDIMATTMMVT